MSSYPGIDELENIFIKTGLKISHHGLIKLDDLEIDKLELIIRNDSFTIFIDDEYGDLKIKNKLLDLCLIFFEIEDYLEEEDFLKWCTSKGFSASNNIIREYYMDLRYVVPKLCNYLGKSRCPISSFDFELNAGAAQYLRSGKAG